MPVDLKALLAALVCAGCATTSSPPTPSPTACPQTHAAAPRPAKALVVDAFQHLQPLVAACFDRYKAAGTYLVNIDVAPTGALERVCIDGDGDPTTSRCIEDAARQGLHPPPSDGSTPYSLTYPFIFR